MKGSEVNTGFDMDTTKCERIAHPNPFPFLSVFFNNKYEKTSNIEKQIKVYKRPYFLRKSKWLISQELILLLNPYE